MMTCLVIYHFIVDLVVYGDRWEFAVHRHVQELALYKIILHTHTFFPKLNSKNDDYINS